MDEIEEAIRPGGISKVKSARIKAILRRSATAPGGRAGRRRRLSLDWLADLSVEEAQALPDLVAGRGPKDGRVRAPVALGMHDVPVDTHVSRVSTRLGLFRPGRAV